MPEVDVMVPDPGFIAERRDRLVGLVITHAHEDHIGAVAWLWPQLRCPVYATPFAAAVLRRKLGEARLLGQVKLNVIPPGGSIDLPPFGLRFLRVAHSIPEAQALAITHAGTASSLHTGDWKLDPEPLVGPPTDEAAFEALGDAGVLAMVCDSTNAMVEGHSGSEAEVRRSLRRTDARPARARRGHLLCQQRGARRVDRAGGAADAGRSVALVGRSLRNLDAAARECGYLKDVPDFVAEDDADDDPRRQPADPDHRQPGRAARALARSRHGHASAHRAGRGRYGGVQQPRHPRQRAGDPHRAGQSGAARRAGDDRRRSHDPCLAAIPARDELRRLYRLVRPRYAVPVHGEWRHLSAHAALAQEAGTTPILMEDGDMLSLAPGAAEVVDSAPVGRIAVDGSRLVPLDGGVFAARRRMLYNGIVLGSLAVDAAGDVRGAPRISAPGLFEPDDPENARVAADFGAAVADLPAGAAPRRRCARRKLHGRHCAVRLASGCRSDRWWTCICCASSDPCRRWMDGDGLVHGFRAVHPDLVDRAVRGAALRHAPGQRGRICRPGGAGRRNTPHLLRKVIATTLVAALVWAGAYALITSDYLSFRHGFLAMPDH